jgi:hypothetical protein
LKIGLKGELRPPGGPRDGFSLEKFSEFERKTKVIIEGKMIKAQPK